MVSGDAHCGRCLGAAGIGLQGRGPCSAPASQPLPRSQVEPIIEDVRVRGDEAVREYTLKFDHANPAAVCTPIEVCLGVVVPCGVEVLGVRVSGRRRGSESLT